MYRQENAMECFPIVDTQSGICQEYMRSAIGLKPGCALGPREQVTTLKIYFSNYKYHSIVFFNPFRHSILVERSRSYMKQKHLCETI